MYLYSFIYIQRACRQYGAGGPSQQSLGDVGGSSELTARPAYKRATSRGIPVDRPVANDQW